ncbi:OmpA/MotB family protein [Nocardioides daeguensis]|uniref:Flagellar motor protein MotB n=1 Tax=Nocardioides daeguensis TaxID=908359 RepID=A0ABP6V8W4_9ACTN|nr:flagellar motor protein MotB [Nocardioides daeguensis]MBV6726134.1 flagellar motor protein MotB [Nocardioides daeguensis]MCR1771977.1 flagellar motor protein MotB [Nocardioides daeguensis]
MSSGKAGRGTSPPRRRHHEEEHEDHGAGHERWLVTYADMVTLLMVLFIVMFAMSNVDEKKYEELKEGLAVGFGREQSILNGASPVSNAKGVTAENASFEMLLAQVPENQRETVTKILQESDRLKSERTQGAARAEVDRLLKVWKKIDKALRDQGLRDDVRATIDERGLVVSLVSQHVVFDPDIAELTERGRRVVDAIAPVLAELHEPIELDGHTNQEPVKPRYYPSDWELSLARAANVLHRLEDTHGIPARRLRATGFGHTKPLVDPARTGSQRVNKRVDVLVLSQQPAETRALMGQAYDELRREAGLEGLPIDPAGDGTASGPDAAARPAPADSREERP